MANPRNTVAFEGIGEVLATFIIDNSTITFDDTKVGGSAAVGKAVEMSAANTVALAADGAEVIGKLIKVSKDLKATVQIKGGMSLPGGNGAALTVGKKIVGALDAGAARGFIREVATGTAAELGLARGFIIDAGTPASTVVML